MIERRVDIQTRDGLMNTFITYPEEGEPFPPVLLYMYGEGVREELRETARRIGAAGYYVLLPNLYYRDAREVVIDGSDASRAQLFELMSRLTIERVNADTAAMLDFLAGEAAEAQPGGVGCVGYCFGGQYAFAAAAAFPDRVRVAASIHGVGLFRDAPDSPHRTADRVKGELYFACAEIDPWVPKATIDALEAHLREIGVRHRVEWYPGTHHGFVFPENRATYDKAASERHWASLFALFARTLR